MRHHSRCDRFEALNYPLCVFGINFSKGFHAVAAAHANSMTKKPAIASLTGLRGVAAMLVVLHHYSYWCVPFSGPRPEWLHAVFGTERLGMTCFFVLSGFVITYNYLDFGWRQQPLKSTVHFVFLRFSRLYPALLVFIGLLVM